MKTYLKVKIKHLGAEARIIKEEKDKWLKKAARGRANVAKRDGAAPNAPSNMANYLHEHRINCVRKECRDSHLAYGFIRGLRYEQVEARRYTDPNWLNVFAIIQRFYNPIYGINMSLEDRFREWKDLAPGKNTRNVRKRTLVK